jgi:co-chaperonin GroES (HSP10)
MLDEQVTNFADAHPPVSVELDDEEGTLIEIPWTRLPQMLSWNVLLRPCPVADKTKGGLYLPPTVQDGNEYLAFVFQVLVLGPLAFTHPSLQGDGVVHPKVGDWVIAPTYSGVDLTLDGARLRMVEDKYLKGIVDSPRGWRAYVA